MATSITWCQSVNLIDQHGGGRGMEQNQDMHCVVQRSLPVRRADPGELDVSCLDCHHNTTMPVAALLPRYAAETPFSGGVGRVSLFRLRFEAG